MNVPAHPLTQEEQAIVRTVAFFAAFGYPLTVQEIVKYAPQQQLESHEVWRAVHSLAQRGVCSEVHGLVMLAGQESGAQERAVRYPHALIKHRRALRWMRWLRMMPGVEGIAIGNSLAYHFTNAKSDSDFFIVTKKGYTWVARLCTTAPLMLLRQRPGQRAQHPMDVSFYADQDHLQLQQVALHPADPYLEHWFMSLAPIYEGSWWEQVWEENQTWAKKYPNARPVRRAYAFRLASHRWKIVVPLWCEGIAARLQRWQFPASITLFMNNDSRVRVEEGLLKFHTNDRRAEYAQKYEQLCRSLGVTPYQQS